MIQTVLIDHCRALLSVHRQPAVNNIFLAVHRFRTADDLPVFGNVSEGLYQALGILPRVAEQSEESRLPAIVRMGFV